MFTSIRWFFFDHQTWKRLSKESISTRKNISEQFAQFKTGWGRLKYVRYLQALNIKPEGNWIDGKIPNIKNDEASTLLAQLEEKWLGLDR